VRPGEDDRLAAQLAYYRRRADEYDSDLYRDPGVADRFGSILDVLAPRGRTVELACGTGIWTALLAGRVPDLTAVDGSPEMLARARDRLGSAAATLVEADLFGWRPDGLYDTVFFAFWLSHVPPDRFDRFWAGIGRVLAPGGRVLFVDTGTEEARYERFVENTGVPMVERRLRDGSRHQIVKVLHEPVDLEEKLEAIGWDADVRPAGGTLYAGSASLRSGTTLGDATPAP
jgi:SAM-dependent methyltransferase